jgi:hypothetical protein
LLHQLTNPLRPRKNNDDWTKGSAAKETRILPRL